MWVALRYIGSSPFPFKPVKFPRFQFINGMANLPKTCMRASQKGAPPPHKRPIVAEWCRFYTVEASGKGETNQEGTGFQLPLWQEHLIFVHQPFDISSTSLSVDRLTLEYL